MALMVSFRDSRCYISFVSITFFFLSFFQAALSLAAIQEHQRSQKGRFVNYNQLPDIFWNDLLPKEFGVPVDDAMRQRIQAISQSYSKDKGRKGITFKGDGEDKRQSATPEVVAAAQTFAGDVYHQLETLSGAKLDGERRRQ